MDWTDSRSVQTTIKRLGREIRELEDFVYNEGEIDDVLRASNLERRRDDIVRASVLSIHTAIEDVLSAWIACRILGATPETIRSRRGTVRSGALTRLLLDRNCIGFHQKLELTLSLGLIARHTYARLKILNGLRNKCSHNWLLRTNVRRGRRPSQKKPPLLRYEQRDLHRAEVLKEFLGEFGPMYARLFVRYLDG